MIEVYTANITTILGYVQETWNDVNVLIWFAIGLPLGFWVVRKAISLVRAR